MLPYRCTVWESNSRARGVQRSGRKHTNGRDGYRCTFTVGVCINGGRKRTGGGYMNTKKAGDVRT